MLYTLISADLVKTISWIVFVAAALGLITILVHTLIVSRRKKKNSGGVSPEANSENEAINEEQYVDAANADKIVLSRNVVYSAGADGQIKAGKYAMESADDSTDKFNVRYNGLVKEYSNGDKLTLTDGDTLSPVSGAIVLNKAE